MIPTPIFMDCVADLIEQARIALVEKIEVARPLHGYEEALRETPKESAGLYLIYAADGTLLYVGESRDIRGRLLNHTLSPKGLLGDLLSDRKFRVYPEGKDDWEYQARKREVTLEIRKTCRVRLFLSVDAWARKKRPGHNRRNNRMARYYEKILTWILAPKFGSHYWPVGPNNNAMVPNVILDPEFDEDAYPELIERLKALAGKR